MQLNMNNGEMTLGSCNRQGLVIDGHVNFLVYYDTMRPAVVITTTL